jgi:MFS family permease
MRSPSQPSTPTAEAKENSKPDRALSRNVLVLGLVSFFTDISSEMTLTLVPLFLANCLGVGTAAIGLIEGIAETTASLTKIFSGWASDRWGRRKAPALLGYGLSALAKPFLYFAGSWGAVLGVRLADRLGKGIRTAPRDALIADSSRSQRRGLSFGFHRAADSAGAFLGLTITAWVVYGWQGEQLLLQRSTFQTLVLLGIVPAVTALMLLALFVRDPEQKPEAGRSVLTSSFGRLGGRFNSYLGIVVLFALGNSSDAFLILRAQTLGLSVFQVILALVCFNLIYALVATPAGGLSDRLGRPRLLLAGWLAYGAIYLGFALAGAGWQVWLLFGLYGAYYGVAEGISRALVADVVSPRLRGTAYGLYNGAVGLAALPASLIAGLLWQGAGPWPGFGPAAPFYFGSALAVLAAILLWAWNRKASMI